MAGANNKSAKGLGYSAKQVETVRKSGGVLSHAALMAHGEPTRPTKKYKALVADMAERKKGLTRKAEPPTGWKAAAKGEGKAQRDAATAARAAFVAKRASAKGGNLDLRKQTERRYELTERLRAKTDDLREARRSAMNSGDDARVAKLDSQIKRMTARADRADEGWTRMGTALGAAPAEKRQQWEAKAERAEKRKALIARTAQNIGDVSRISRGMRQKKGANRVPMKDRATASGRTVGSVRNAARATIDSIRSSKADRARLERGLANARADWNAARKGKGNKSAENEAEQRVLLFSRGLRRHDEGVERRKDDLRKILKMRRPAS